MVVVLNDRTLEATLPYMSYLHLGYALREGGNRAAAIEALRAAVAIDSENVLATAELRRLEAP